MTTSLIIKPEQKRLNRSIHTGVGQTNIRINLAPETGNRAQFARQMPEQRHHGSKRLDRSAEQRQGGREDVPLGECQFELINPGADEIRVKVGLGRGDIRDARLVLSGAISSKSLSPNAFYTGAPVVCPNGATTILSGSYVNRRELVIVCDEDAAAKVYICGYAGSLAGQGLPLAPGQSLTLETSASVYCRNDTGAAVAVAVAGMAWSS